MGGHFADRCWTLQPTSQRAIFPSEVPLVVWLLAAASFAGKHALRKAAIGMVALPPGGVVVESSSPWQVVPAGEADGGVELMQAAQQVAYDCFAPRFSINLLSGAADGWQVVVDAAVGPGGRLGPPLVDGIALGDELECLASGLEDLPAGADAVGMTFRISAASPQPLVGDARVRVLSRPPPGDGSVDRRILRFEARAQEIALACARQFALASGRWTGAGPVLDGAPDDFAACWSEQAASLDPWVDGSDSFELVFSSAAR